MPKESTLLAQMRAQIDLCRKGDLNLGSLIDDLSCLHREIPGQDEAWKESVWAKIGDLEQVYAVMLDRGIERLDEPGRQIVDQAILGLMALLGEAKEQADPEAE